MENSRFKMVNVSSYGNKIYETVILESSTIEEVKEKYLKMQGSYMRDIFEREFNKSKGHFTLANSYDTIHVSRIQKSYKNDFPEDNEYKQADYIGNLY